MEIFRMMRTGCRWICGGELSWWCWAIRNFSSASYQEVRSTFALLKQYALQAYFSEAFTLLEQARYANWSVDRAVFSELTHRFISVTTIGWKHSLTTPSLQWRDSFEQAVREAPIEEQNYEFGTPGDISPLVYGIDRYIRRDALSMSDGRITSFVMGAANDLVADCWWSICRTDKT
jgi:hypothetical protein